MGFLEATRYCLRHYAELNGRATRSEFWFFMGACFLISLVATVADISLYPVYPPEIAELMPINLALNILLLIPNISAAARRLHDTGRSAKWQFIAVTGIGMVPLLYWLLKNGDRGANKFGPAPNLLT